MNKKFIYHLVLLVAANLLVKPFWIFGVDRNIQIAVETEAYGMYFAVFSLTIAFNSILDPGLSQFVSQFFSKNSKLIKAESRNLFHLKTTLSFLYAFALLIIGVILGYNQIQTQFLLILSLAQIFSSFSVLFRTLITARQNYRAEIFLSNIEKIILIIVMSYLLWFSESEHVFQMVWLAKAQLFAAFVGMFLSAILLGLNFRNIIKQPNWQLMFRIFKKTIPFALLIFFMGMYYRLDVIMLGYMLPNGNYHTGIYAQSYRILEGLSMFAYLSASYLLPRFSRLLSENKNIAQISTCIFHIQLIPAIFVLLAALFFSDNYIELLYHENNPYSANIFSVLLAAFPAVVINYVFGTLLTADGQLKTLNYLAGSALVLNLMLNLLLIPQYKGIGAAIASVSTHYFMAFMQMYFAIKTRKAYQLKSNLIRILVFIIFSSLVFSYFSNMQNISFLVKQIILVFIIGSSGLFILFIGKPLGVHRNKFR